MKVMQVWMEWDRVGDQFDNGIWEVEYTQYIKYITWHLVINLDTWG